MGPAASILVFDPASSEVVRHKSTANRVGLLMGLSLRVFSAEASRKRKLAGNVGRKSVSFGIRRAASEDYDYEHEWSAFSARSYHVPPVTV